ncbi:MAG: orotate phosphoribosyltransferase [Magnetococcales bacterium]|nr:orotate phosphoribosyltransferase [Magnetococcales bacterium]
MPNDTATAFLRFALETGVLKFGRFQTKAGRQSPYFFNAGLFHSGQAMARLGQFYAEAIQASAIPHDMLFGPAYKGIPLAVATAIALAQHHDRDLPYAYNRKEAKDHGEGGTLVGAAISGRALVIDDVISAGTSVRESVALINREGGSLAGVVIALDRQERGTGSLGAATEVAQSLNAPVAAIARLEDLIRLLEEDPSRSKELDAIRAYRDRYGAA